MGTLRGQPAPPPPPKNQKRASICFSPLKKDISSSDRFSSKRTRENQTHIPKQMEARSVGKSQFAVEKE